MSIASRLSSWFRSLRRRKQDAGPYPGRREFVYLDEVSVLSILASWTGGITTEITETQSISQNSEVNSSLGVGLGGTKADFGTKMQAGQVDESQVLRKAIIQTSFKDLYDIERSALTLRLSSPKNIPPIDSTRDLEKLLDSPDAAGLLIHSSSLHRGDLLEVEIELDADPIYRMATMITTLVELMGDSEDLLEKSITTQLPMISSIARLLERLLAGLVPIRGRLVDYAWIRICNRDVLVRQSFLCQIPAMARPQAYPVYLVGVAQSDLFWKDIRRVLFSQARYTVFCRLATSGLTDRWNPIKMADVFTGILSDFDEMVQGMGDELLTGFNKSMRLATTRQTADAPPTTLNLDAKHGERILQNYVESLARHHKRTIEPAVALELIREIQRAENWLDSVDGYREVFIKVTANVDKMLKVKTSQDEAHELRSQALAKSRREETAKLDGSTARGNHPEPRFERFLDAEIVAIYW